MRKFIARRLLKSFSARYEYDIGYMQYMLDVSPSAFFKYAALAKLARHRETASKEALYAAKLVGALIEDCGPCVQLVVDMAREAGVADDQIEAVLAHDMKAMTRDTLLAYSFAQSIARRSPRDAAARDAVRSQWGDSGVVELTLALQVSRLFPMVKAGLGYARTCQRIDIGGRNIAVVNRAA